MNKCSTHVVVAMSGGVDSSVAAWLLKQQGYQVSGLFMKNWEEDDTDEYCNASQDLEDAQQVCNNLGIKLHTINFAAEYWDNVFSVMLEELRKFRSPNPDILCNREIKFKVFIEHAKLLGADYIATGHYAKLQHHGNGVALCKSNDLNKDQSYFLYALNQQQLSVCIFPLSEINKNQVRSIAEQNNFINYNKKDSTGICFIGERRFKEFLKNYLPSKPGDIVSVAGEVIGSHEGLMYYTIGQRHGLNVGGVKNKEEFPWYVIAKDVANNSLIVCQGNDNPRLFAKALIATNLHWIQDKAIPNKSYQAKIRYRQTPQECQIIYHEHHCEVQFIQPQRAITPGQSVVFYDNDICLGGGIIEKAI